MPDLSCVFFTLRCYKTEGKFAQPPYPERLTPTPGSPAAQGDPACLTVLCVSGTCRAVLCPSSACHPVQHGQPQAALGAPSALPRAGVGGDRRAAPTGATLWWRWAVELAVQQVPASALEKALFSAWGTADRIAPLPPPRSTVFWSPFLYRKSTTELIFISRK